jgi:hypothetical protein
MVSIVDILSGAVPLMLDVRQTGGSPKGYPVWDGLPSHRGRSMQAFIKKQRKWLVVEPLPPYAPDLDPVEQIWGNLKGSELANLCLDTVGEAEEIVDQGLCRIGNETRLAFAFLRHCGLKLCTRSARCCAKVFR